MVAACDIKPRTLISCLSLDSSELRISKNVRRSLLFYARKGNKKAINASLLK